MTRVRFALLACSAMTLLAACVHLPPPALVPWALRLPQLEKETSWHMQGRAAVAVGAQGWQAHIDWQEDPGGSRVTLSGPFGLSAVQVVIHGKQIQVMNAEVADGEEFLRQKLGFVPPFDALKSWLRGAPSDESLAQISKNAQDRLSTLREADWLIEYPEYARAGSDVLPSRVLLSHADIRLKLAVDRWDVPAISNGHMPGVSR